MHTSESDDAGQVQAVCITTSVQARSVVDDSASGINKRPVDRIAIRRFGVDGDKVLDTAHHGGVDKAVYAYAAEDAAWWSTQLQTEIPAGRFGENLQTLGIDVTGALIGERWGIGNSVVVEVSEPRIPCQTFQHHMDDRSGWVKAFMAAGRPGAYLRVIEGGQVHPDMPVTVLSRPDHGVSIGRWFVASDPDDAQALLDAQTEEWSIGPALRRAVDHVLGGG